MSQKKFFLKCVQGLHPDIELPHLMPVIIGRSPMTQITDTRLSKEHLKLTADSENKQVKCKLIGHNSAMINNDTTLKKGQECSLKVGDKIQLLVGQYEHELLLKNVNKGHWSQGLYESMNDPQYVIYKDDQVCIIKDKYPKALKHFLVLPMLKITTIYDLKDLNLVKYMIDISQKHILKAHPDVTFKSGFHAVPSMAQVHMHVISQDFHSDCLKTKKHWNSFNTTYFIPSDQIIADLEKYGNLSHLKETQNAKELLSKDLICNQCAYKPKNMPDLKSHLKKHLK